MVPQSTFNRICSRLQSEHLTLTNLNNTHDSKVDIEGATQAAKSVVEAIEEKTSREPEVEEPQHHVPRLYIFEHLRVVISVTALITGS